MDRFTALQVFRHIAQEGSFAAAGRRLGLSPAAVSKNVAELEAHLKTRLLNRTTRRMALTEEGQLYLDHVTRGLDLLADGERLLQAGREAPAGRLKVSAPTTVGLTLLSRAIPAFLTQHPALSLDLDLSDRPVDLVREGFDLAIRGTRHLEDSALVARKLVTMRYVVCASPAYFAAHGQPESPADLARHSGVRFSHTAESWTFSRGDKQETVRLNARYTVSSSLAIVDALRAGFGLCIIPKPYVAADLRSGTLISVLDDWQTPELNFYAVYPSRLYLTPKVRALIDCLTNALQA